MAGNAVIGALRVNLGLDSAQFETGLKNAQSGLAKFGKSAGVGLAAAAAAATAATVAIGFAVKGAIDHADALSKTAQKIGVSVEALSRLEYAAKLSDVSLDGLSDGLRKLSQNMAVIAQGGKGPAAVAFEALGVAATAANGQLRASDEVMAEVAGKFARMEDGSTKTALAVALFGKSGADLIPLLNSGSTGLKAMADESDRLGITLSTGTARGAEAFNDTLTRIGGVLEGVINKVMVSALPALQSLADTLASPEFAAAAQTLATNVIGGLGKIIEAIVEVINWLDRMERQANRESAIERLADTLSGGAGGTPNRKHKVSDVYGGMLGDDGQIQMLGAPQGAAEEAAAIDPLVVNLGALTAASTAATAAQKALDAALTEGKSVMEATRNPFETMQLELDKLGHLLNEKAIDWETFGRAANAAKMTAVSAAFGMASQVTGALEQIFEGNKGFAAASAIVNTLEGVTKALAQGGIFGFIGAAAIAASGAAQVASILSTNEHSTSMPGVATASVATPAAQQSQAGAAVTLQLNGGGRYSRDEIAGIIEDINDALGDGYKLNLQGG